MAWISHWCEVRVYWLGKRLIRQINHFRRATMAIFRIVNEFIQKSVPVPDEYYCFFDILQGCEKPGHLTTGAKHSLQQSGLQDRNNESLFLT